MATLTFCCGAGCGIDATGTASGGVEHWNTKAGSAVDTTPPVTLYSAQRAFRFNPSAASWTLRRALTGFSSGGTAVARFHVYFTTLPTGDTTLINFYTGGVAVGNVIFIASDGTLRARAMGNNAASGVSVTTGKWYRVDLKVVAAASRTTDIQVTNVTDDGAPQSGAQATASSTNVTIDELVLGFTSTFTADFYLTDIAVSATSGDYPIGAGYCIALYPNADGSHTYNSATDFGDGAGGTTALATPSSSQTDTWQSLENPLNLTVDTNFVGAIGADVTLTGDRPAEFLRFAFENLPADADTINGVQVDITSHSAATTASNIRIHVDDGTNTPPAAVISADMSETSIATAVAMATVAGDGAAWSVAKVNSTFVRFSSSDVTPDVFLDGVCLEVDYVPAVGPADDYPSWRRFTARQLLPNS